MTTENDTRESVSAFAVRCGITMEAKLLGVGPDYAGSAGSFTDPKATHWRVTFKRALSDDQNALFSTEYHMGSAHWHWKQGGEWGKQGEPVSSMPYHLQGKLWGEEKRKQYAVPTPPTLDDVLDSLRHDAEGIENARTFDDWASEYGYDADSRKAEATYRACQDIASKLARFLGSTYRELFETESA